ncbi:hypothetical protein F3J29_11850 [Enterobacter sp. Cy-643]|uniref:hypothetical protein n=1 Tax=Enterobacter sp. Cy-643 TaxID=2608346 RepID=UPI00141F7BBC|nr:hypothetical protein [Enterobacter sp. Cy-643]NIF32821.1 hypothetical protein [Enterobacter sp. Cy-643]
MMYNNKYMAFLFIAIIIIFSVAMLKNNTPVSLRRNLECVVKYNAIGENSKLFSVIRIAIASETGVAVLHGMIKDEHGHTNEVTANVFFRVNVINDSFVLTSLGSAVRLLNQDPIHVTLEYEDLLPGIFTKMNNLAVYSIHSLEENKYFFTLGESQAFLCDGEA